MCDISKALKLAKESIVLIDDFVDENTFKVLEYKPTDVKLTICSKNRIMAQLRNVVRRKSFQSKLNCYEIKSCGGRYVLIDNSILFLLSRSLCYNAKRNFYFIRIHDFEIIARIRQVVSESVGKARNLYRHF
jgi:hypothetical protein